MRAYCLIAFALGIGAHHLLIGPPNFEAFQQVLPPRYLHGSATSVSNLSSLTDTAFNNAFSGGWNSLLVDRGDSSPYLVEEIRLRLRQFTKGELAKLASTLNLDDEGSHWAAGCLLTELGSKDAAAAWEVLSKWPRQKSILGRYVLKGIARTSPYEALRMAAAAPMEEQAALRISVYLGWAQHDSKAAWKQLCETFPAPGATIVAVARELVRESPETVGAFIRDQHSKKIPLPDGFLLQVLSQASEAGTEIASRIVMSLPVELRLNAAVALGRGGFEIGVKEVLKQGSGIFNDAETSAMLRAWSAEHSQNALVDVAGQPPTARAAILKGIVDKAMLQPHEADVAWQQMTPVQQKEMLIPMAKGLAVHDSSKALAWVGSLAMDQQQEALDTVFKFAFPRNPARCLDLALTRPDAGSRVRSVTSVGSAWAATEPNSAANWVVHQGDPELLEPALSSILPLWGKRDIDGMNEWLQSAKLPPEVLESLLKKLTNAENPSAMLPR